MKDKDYIKEIFSDKLGNYEAKVSPELWNGIASQIGVTGTTIATGMSIVTKWIIGVSIASIVVVSTIVIVNGGDEPEKQIENEPIAQTQTNSTEISSTVDTESLDVNPTESEQVLVEDINIERVTESVQPTLVIPDEPMPVELAKNKKQGINQSTNETKQPVIENNNPLLEIVEKEEPVHTPDPIVYEPSYPAEIAPEESTTQSTNFSIGKLPNVFTPNRDGENDYFRIESENLTGFAITVLNSENAVVFQSSNPNFVWDGRDLAGENVPDGNYVYFITANEFSRDKPKRFSPLLIKRSR